MGDALRWCLQGVGEHGFAELGGHLLNDRQRM